MDANELIRRFSSVFAKEVLQDQVLRFYSDVQQADKITPLL
jgi:hypothetical protein